eukprot:SAG31_NODE_15960_length_729_cov_3.115942_1_plen_47_part_01
MLDQVRARDRLYWGEELELGVDGIHEAFVIKQSHDQPVTLWRAIEGS